MRCGGKGSVLQSCDWKCSESLALGCECLKCFLVSDLLLGQDGWLSWDRMSSVAKVGYFPFPSRLGPHKIVSLEGRSC